MVLLHFLYYRVISETEIFMKGFFIGLSKSFNCNKIFYITVSVVGVPNLVLEEFLLVELFIAPAIPNTALHCNDFNFP